MNNPEEYGSNSRFLVTELTDFDGNSSEQLQDDPLKGSEIYQGAGEYMQGYC